MKKFLAGSIIGVFTITAAFSVGPSSQKSEETGYYSHNRAQQQAPKKKSTKDGYYSYKAKQPKSKKTEDDGYYSDQRRKEGTNQYTGKPSSYSDNRQSPCRSQSCEIRKDGSKGPDFEKEKKEPSSMVL